MFLRLTETGSVDRFGLSESDIRAAHKNVSFPVTMSDHVVSHLRYYSYQSTPRTAFDPYTQRVIELAPAKDSQGKWTQRWQVSDIPAAEVASSLSARKAGLVSSIDADVDAVIAKAIGNRAQEYLLAEQEALAFVAAGYPVGSVPGSVAVDAQAYQQTPKWSADRIVAQAAAWRSAQLQIRGARLASKAAVGRASSHAQVTAEQSSWQAALKQITDSLGI